MSGDWALTAFVSYWIAFVYPKHYGDSLFGSDRKFIPLPGNTPADVLIGCDSAAGLCKCGKTHYFGEIRDEG